MSWAGDKKEILSKLVDLYQEIEASPNRWEASLCILNNMDFFIERLQDEQAITSEMFTSDREWFHAYFTTMSELMGEEK